MSGDNFSSAILRGLSETGVSNVCNPEAAIAVRESNGHRKPASASYQGDISFSVSVEISGDDFGSAILRGLSEIGVGDVCNPEAAIAVRERDRNGKPAGRPNQCDIA